MLAAEAVLGEVKYPKLVSKKLNGVRGLVVDGKITARSLKRIPNKHLQAHLDDPLLEGFDGELVACHPETGRYLDGNDDNPWVFSLSTSTVMSDDKVFPFKFFVFDLCNHPQAFQFRCIDLRMRVEKLKATGKYPFLEFVEHYRIECDEPLQEIQKEALEEGYEGLVVRGIHDKYKYGRSTALEGGFMRFCPWLRSEAVILDFKESESNQNEAKTNELGRTARSTAKAGKVKTGSCGSVYVKDLKTGVEFRCPLDTEETGKYFWENKDIVRGKVIKYKYKPSTKIKPRFPEYEGFRDERDMS